MTGISGNRSTNPVRHTSTDLDILDVAVIGAGFGGIGMATALRRAGNTRFAVFEQSNAVGGVWRDNTYPGCNCDVPAHLYSFSFSPYRSTRQRYPGQAQILDYLHRIVIEEGLIPYIRLGVGITEATYLDDECRWRLSTDTGQHVTAEVVVFALGQLHRPNIPDLAGIGEFSGTTFHTARWDHDHDLTGREVAVIGTGSSAAQILPSVADIARRVRVFQRSPHWVLPKPAAEFGLATRMMLGLPGAHRLYRRMLAEGADLVISPIMRRRWSAAPAELLARRHLHNQLLDPALRAQLTPRYPIGGKKDNHRQRLLPDTDSIECRTHCGTDPGGRSQQSDHPRRHPS